MPTPAISSLTLRLFERIVRRYLRRHFRAVLAQRTEALLEPQGPLIVYLNHSSWWDPMVCIHLARTLLPHRRHFAPMDATQLRRYRILGRIGLFPVDTSTPRSAATFLTTAEAILRDNGVLWITPQGRFADNREPALGFKPGLAALAARVPNVTLLPLAIEYPFWDERLPEALIRFGEPQAPASTEALEQALQRTMDDLRASSLTRSEAGFRVLLSGTRGTGGVYALLQRFRSLFARDKAPDDHSPRY